MPALPGELGVELPASERVAVRIGASLVSNGLRLGFSFVGGLLIARGLGASEYGGYQFLLASVASLSQLIDLGTSQAFFTFVARERRHSRFVVLYGSWLALQFVVVVAAVGVIMPRQMIEALWLGESRGLILLAFAGTFLMNEVWEAVGQLGEARRRTLATQTALTVQSAAHLALIAGAVALGRLSVPLLFVFIIVEYGALVCIVGPRVVRANISSEAPPPESVRALAAEFWQYSRPLVWLTAAGFAVTFADRWMLQRFGGAAQQGYFALGQQLSTLSLVAANSVLQVFWTEVAAATASGDRHRTVMLFRATSRALYFVAAWVTCLVIPYTREILAVTAGPEYAAAALSFALMLLYPLHQSLGRVCGVFLQSAGETALYSRVSVATLVLSLPLGYLLLAPRGAAIPGLDLGAVGLTVKLVLLGVLSVNLMLFVIARRLETHYDWTHQIITVGVLAGIAFGVRSLVGQFAAASPLGMPIAGVVAGAAAYVAISGVLMYSRPALVGLTRPQLTSIAGIYRRLVKP